MVNTKRTRNPQKKLKRKSTPDSAKTRRLTYAELALLTEIKDFFRDNPASYCVDKLSQLFDAWMMEIPTTEESFFEIPDYQTELILRTDEIRGFSIAIGRISTFLVHLQELLHKEVQQLREEGIVLPDR